MGFKLVMQICLFEKIKSAWFDFGVMCASCITTLLIMDFFLSAKFCRNVSNVTGAAP